MTFDPTRNVANLALEKRLTPAVETPTSSPPGQTCSFVGQPSSVENELNQPSAYRNNPAGRSYPKDPGDLIQPLDDNIGFITSAPKA
jgi:hypothetical protein